MLFLIHRPTELLISSHNKIILTTPHQIIFTTLHFLEQFLSRELAAAHPEMVRYSDEASEAAVASKGAIQIYWTDWHSRIELRYFIALSGEDIYSMAWKNQWTVYGEFRQYSPKGMKLVRTQSYDQYFSSCFVGQLQFILTNKRLVSYSHKARKLMDVEWRSREEDTQGFKEGEVRMKGIRVGSGEVLLALNSLCVVLKEQRVEKVVHHEGTLYISEDVVLWINQGKRMMIYQVKESSLIPLGESEAFEGQLLGCALTEEKIAFILYDFKELQVKHMRLVNQQQNLEFQRLKREKQRLKEGLKSTIEEKTTTNPNPPTKPVSTGSLQLALKAQIEKFQSQLHRSFSAHKFNEQNIVESQIIPAPTPVEVLSFPQKLQQSSNRPISADSIAHVNEQRQEEQQGLFQHGQSGFQWQQMESNYEQPQLTSGMAPAPPFHFDNQHQVFAETPVFNDINVNRWNQVSSDWNFLDQGNAEDVIEQIEESEKTIEGQRKSGNSSKTIKSSQGRKYTQILAEVYRKDPDKFDEVLQDKIGKLIQENEARIFFADHIRIHNPILTRDRLYRLYCHLPDNDQNKRLMAKALSDFRLQEVPAACLPIRKEVISIFDKIYPSVYIQNLLQPSVALIEQFIQSYFSKDFSYDSLTIEDEVIQLAHPRNLLNIILYLNENYQLPLETIFEVYIKKMIRHGQVSILKRIMESKVCEICGISRQIFEKCAENTAREMLQENKGKSQRIQEVMLLMNAKTRRTYVQVISLVGYLNQYKIVYQVKEILSVSSNKNSQEVVRKIISSSSPQNLSKISFPFIFRAFGKIQKQSALPHYLHWHISIIKEVSELLIANKYLKDAASIIFPLVPIIRRGFMAKLLIKYLGGKYANRLASPREAPNEIISTILAQIIQNEVDQLKGDSFPNTSGDEQWQKFSSLCRSYLKYQCWELAYIFYHDRHLARELINESIITQADYDYLTLQFKHKKPTKISFIDINMQQVKIPLLYEIDSHKSNESAEFNQSYSPKSDGQRPLLQQSYRGFDTVKQFDHQLGRSLRKHNDGIDPALILLKIQVQNDSILAMLKEIYEQYPRDKFISALTMVDREKVQLHHIEVYKSLAQLNIAYPFQRLIPFEYFKGEDEHSWKKVELSVKSELTYKNFWTIYLLADMLYGKGSEVAFSFIERVIYYEMDDGWFQSIEQMLKGINLSPMQIKELSLAAGQRGLLKTQQVLSVRGSDFLYYN